MSYGELDRRANQLAHRLIQLGVAPDVPVGVMIPRSMDLIVAIFGVLKAGGAYVPMDPAYPPDRLAMMLEDSEVGLCDKRFCLTTVTARDSIVTCVGCCAGASPAKPEGGLCQARPRHRGACSVGAPMHQTLSPVVLAAALLYSSHVWHCCNLHLPLDELLHLSRASSHV